MQPNLPNGGQVHGIHMAFIFARFMSDAQSQHLITAFFGVLAVLVFAFLAMIIMPSWREDRCEDRGHATKAPAGLTEAAGPHFPLLAALSFHGGQPSNGPAVEIGHTRRGFPHLAHA